MIPNKNDSWIVIGPGRTGSLVIIETIRRIYDSQIKIQLQYRDPNDLKEKIEPGQILHTHQIESLSLMNANTFCILSTRNVIESSLSWCIRPYIGEWHLWEGNSDSRYHGIDPFYLDKREFLKYFNRMIDFYNTIVLPKSTIIIDYSQFQDNPSKLLPLLGFNYELSVDKYLPIKNPGSYADWIINWDEISEMIKDLNYSLPTFIIE